MSSPRFIGRCTVKGCRAVVSVASGERRVAASCGHGSTIYKRVIGVAAATPCDARCTGARGLHCECSCAGANHGAGHAA